MRLIISFILTCLLVLGATALSSTKSYKTFTVETKTYNHNIEDNRQTILPINDNFTSRPSREQMVEEVVAVWNFWYDDDGVKPNHRINKRRKNFHIYAEYLVEAVRYYQEYETNKGGQLPMDENTHIVMAVMVAAETSVRPEVIGKSRGEVGLLQVHGHALQGHKKHEVIDSPWLGVWLGTRWIAYHTQFCHPRTENISKWKQYISVYGAGLYGGRYRNGECKEISLAKRRVRIAKSYSKRIYITTNS